MACANGLGYLLVAQGDDAPYATSCFSADSTHKAAVAAGRKPSDMQCLLPASKDIDAMALHLVQSVNGVCTVRTVQWYGRSTQTHNEYTEVACKEGTGYLLRTPQAESVDDVNVMTCLEAAQKGIPCKLTDAGPVEKPVTLESLKAALLSHGVTCSGTETRLIGQESNRKRYVVEFKCPEHPEGLIAFIPLGDNQHPFQTVDCAKAIEYHVVCELTVH